MSNNGNAISTTTISLLDLLRQLDLMSALVMILLACMLFICTTLTLFKIMSLKSKQKQFGRAWNIISSVMSLEELLEKSALIQRNFIGTLLVTYLADFKSFLRIYNSKNIAITDQDWQVLQAKLYQEVEQEVEKEESYTQILSTCAAIAPLLGLFGTVWGLINSFLTVGEQASNSLASVGSGIAQALLTTIAGLVVAIPALIAYNYVFAQLKTLETSLVKVSEKMNMIMRVVVAQRHTESINTIYNSVPTSKQPEL